MVSLMALLNGVQAQDTVSFCHPPRDKYYVNEEAWDDSNGYITPFYMSHGQVAMCFFAGDSLKIYGIAACVMEMTENRPNYVYDTSYDEAYRFLRLYLPEGDTLRWIAQKKVHLHTTPIAYYANFSTTVPPCYNCIAPMYELFFDSAITMIDTFALGMTYPKNPRHFYDEDSNHYYYQYRPLGIGVLSHMKHTYMVQYVCSYGENGDDSYAQWRHINLPQSYYALFPILVPDTTTGGGTEPDDSLAVQVALVDRVVAVQPNPATERVKVVASCGMERVTAYNATGRKVHEQAATGLSTTLNVQGWPAGTYILHIQTPMGVSTKRLVVAR